MDEISWTAAHEGADQAIHVRDVHLFPLLELDDHRRMSVVGRAPGEQQVDPARGLVYLVVFNRHPSPSGIWGCCRNWLT